MNRMILALAFGLAFLAPAGCKIVKTAATGAADPDVALITGIVDDTWDAKLVPLITSKATDAQVLVPAIAEGLDAAGASFGSRGAGEGGSWTFAVKGQGTITAENRKSRAAALDVDVTGDGKADVTLQLGPVVKGSALRDVAPFYDFTAFRDQIEFAKLARALNDKASSAVALPDGDLTGKSVTFLGAFAVHSAKDTVLIAPISVSVAP